MHMKFLARAIASFASKGGIETQGNPRNGIWSTAVVPCVVASLLGLAVGGTVSIAASQAWRFSADAAGWRGGALAAVETAMSAYSDLAAATSMLAMTEESSRLFPNATPTEAQKACLIDVAPLQDAQIAFMATDAIAGVEGAAQRFGLSDQQALDVARFSALMNLASCMRPHDQSAYAPEGVDPGAADLAIAYRNHLGENHAVAFATMAMAREGAGTGTADLFGKLRAVRAGLFGGTSEGDSTGTRPLAAASLESSAALEAAVSDVRMRPAGDLGGRSLSWISDHAATLAERASYSPEELVFVSLALAETRRSEGRLMPHPDLPESFRMRVELAHDTLGFRVTERDGVPTAETMPPAWSIPFDSEAESHELSTCSLDAAEARTVAAALEPGERVVSCGRTGENGARDIFVIDQAWNLRAAVLDGRFNLDFDTSARDGSATARGR